MSFKRTLGLLSILAVLQQPVIAKETKPKYEPLGVVDVVQTIADYDIHKMLVPPSKDLVGGWSMYLGVTDHSEKTMDLNRMITREYMLLTILHEMRHAKNDRLGLSNREDWTREYACKDYKLFFEQKDCPNQDDLDKLIKREYK